MLQGFLLNCFWYSWAWYTHWKTGSFGGRGVLKDFPILPEGRRQFAVTEKETTTQEVLTGVPQDSFLLGSLLFLI